MNKDLPDEPLELLEEGQEWTYSEKKGAKALLYAVADNLSDAGVDEEPITALIAKFGPQIGTGSRNGFANRLLDAADKLYKV